MDTTAVAASVLTFVEISFVPTMLANKDGRLNLRWFLASAPYLASLCLLLTALAGGIRPEIPASWLTGLGLAATAVAVGSVAIISATLGTHRVKLSLWYQNNDAPESIVTVGPYRMVRHPFYTGFFLAMTSAVLALPHWSTLAALAYSAVALNVTAAREERRLSASRFGREYQEYAQKTGRFVPRLRVRRRITVSATA